LTKCQTKSDVVDGNSSGIGCCQMDILGGLKNITIEAKSFNGHKHV